jgi:hypothetical protein
VLNNTVVLSGTYPNAIEYRFPATTGVEIRFNLADTAGQQRDGASGVASGNVTTAQPGWFVDATGGDLHLTAAAIAAIDRAAPHPDVTRDYDQEVRPAGAAPDIGANELRARNESPSAPTNLLVRERPGLAREDRTTTTRTLAPRSGGR